jgi:hypothetical protein
LDDPVLIATSLAKIHHKTWDVFAEEHICTLQKLFDTFPFFF